MIDVKIFCRKNTTQGLELLAKYESTKSILDNRHNKSEFMMGTAALLLVS